MKSFQLGFLAALLVWCAYANSVWQVSQDLVVKFLDIGQGDSILIETPHGRRVLIDGGPGTTLLERLGEETSFWQQHFDLVILTHPDLDHLEGLVEVVKRYRIDRMLLTGVQHGSALYQAFLELLVERDVEVLVADPEQDWQLDEKVWLDILGPLENVALQESDHPNDTSIVAKLIYDQTSILLPGDIEAFGEQALLLSDADLRSDVLKSGHHGSTTSSSLPFLKAVQAEEVVIQAGRENPFGHPHVETLLRYDEEGMGWRNTGEEGTVVLLSNGETWK